MKLALGTAQFGFPYGIANKTGQVDLTEAKAMLALIKATGIDTLDTAIAYGKSEACLGEAGICGFKVVTKLPSVPDECLDVNNWVLEQVSASHARLCVTSTYGLLLHDSHQLIGVNGKAIYRALQSLKDLGLVHKIGVSIYAPSELDAIAKRYRVDLVQAPFNLVDLRLYRSGWLQRLKDNEVEVHTRSVFLQGLLLMPPAVMPSKFAQWSPLWNRWNHWLTSNNLTAVQACLAFPHAFPEIDRIVVGADNCRQLEQIINAAISLQTADMIDLHCDEENLINPARWAALQ
ncbi:MAG: aldo/keto reductase [Betaproteobacteria bacterium]